MSDFDEITKDLRKSRSGFISRITLILNELEKESINRFIFDRSEKKRNQMQIEIYHINEKIYNLCDEKGIPEDDEKRQSDRATECAYVVKTDKEISNLEAKFPKEVLPLGNQKQEGNKVIDAEALAEMPTLTLLAYSLRFLGILYANTLFVVFLRFFRMRALKQKKIQPSSFIISEDMEFYQ